MQRKTLLIAIAAGAAVGIAVGILASGVAGPLTGSIGPSPTTLTIEYSLNNDPNGPWGGVWLLLAALYAGSLLGFRKDESVAQ